MDDAARGNGKSARVPRLNKREFPVPEKSSAARGMFAPEFLLDFVLESKHSLACLVFARAELAHFVRKFAANLLPIPTCFLSVQLAQFSGATANVRRPAFSGKGNDRSGFGGNRTTAWLDRGR